MKPYIETMLLRERKSIAIDIDVLKKLNKKIYDRMELWDYTDVNMLEALKEKYPFQFAEKGNTLNEIKITRRLAEEAKKQINALVRKYIDPRNYERFRD
jgi:hypothetical protein